MVKICCEILVVGIVAHAAGWLTRAGITLLYQSAQLRRGLRTTNGTQ